VGEIEAMKTGSQTCEYAAAGIVEFVLGSTFAITGRGRLFGLLVTGSTERFEAKGP